MKLFISVVYFFCVISTFADLINYEISNPQLIFEPITESIESIGNNQLSSKWQNQFINQYGEKWTILIDVRGGTPSHIFGSGIPVIPGKGNDLPFSKEATEDEVVSFVKEFIDHNSDLFGIDIRELKLSQATYVGENWYINFVRRYHELPVIGSALMVTISNGN
ncbi:MAG TPA: hypothetical protein PK014_11540 [Thermoanaerobaculia bacterium]|nr:hypothetical protein [Thermoanaerobaculia bacterium]HUM30710.1 hypothetical protein [Thermoanaerobaculia bacterium]HXK69001.1 hypothetical protein [Thermoanaerobaculia bacterium]